MKKILMFIALLMGATNLMAQSVDYKSGITMKSLTLENPLYAYRASEVTIVLENNTDSVCQLNGFWIYYNKPSVKWANLVQMADLSKNYKEPFAPGESRVITVVAGGYSPTNTIWHVCGEQQTEDGELVDELGSAEVQLTQHDDFNITGTVTLENVVTDSDGRMIVNGDSVIVHISATNHDKDTFCSIPGIRLGIYSNNGEVSGCVFHRIDAGETRDQTITVKKLPSCTNFDVELFYNEILADPRIIADIVRFSSPHDIWAAIDVDGLNTADSEMPVLDAAEAKVTVSLKNNDATTFSCYDMTVELTDMSALPSPTIGGVKVGKRDLPATLRGNSWHFETVTFDNLEPGHEYLISVRYRLSPMNINPEDYIIVGHMRFRTSDDLTGIEEIGGNNAHTKQFYTIDGRKIDVRTASRRPMMMKAR